MTEDTRWPAARGRRGVVASPHPLASLAGLQTLLLNNNRIDDFPNSMLKLKGLKDLQVEGNPIAERGKLVEEL